jgi:hypothetical protein
VVVGGAGLAVGFWRFEPVCVLIGFMVDVVFDRVVGVRVRVGYVLGFVFSVLRLLGLRWGSSVGSFDVGKHPAPGTCFIWVWGMVGGGVMVVSAGVSSGCVWVVCVVFRGGGE